jgi:hypothetical protein
MLFFNQSAKKKKVMRDSNEKVMQGSNCSFSAHEVLPRLFRIIILTDGLES